MKYSRCFVWLTPLPLHHHAAYKRVLARERFLRRSDMPSSLISTFGEDE